MKHECVSMHSYPLSAKCKYSNNNNDYYYYLNLIHNHLCISLYPLMISLHSSVFVYF